jgi:hypothetical protein
LKRAAIQAQEHMIYYKYRTPYNIKHNCGDWLTSGISTMLLRKDGQGQAFIRKSAINKELDGF